MNVRRQSSAFSRAESHRNIVVLMTPEVASMAFPIRVCLRQMEVTLSKYASRTKTNSVV